VQNVDAFYIREVGIGTKKTFWLASRKLCWPAMQAAQEEQAKCAVRLARQKIRKGRHIRKAGMKEGRIANGLNVQ
jgi:hypothetical protein